MPTVLVTGANGYIGSAVGRAFRRAGYVVYGLVRRAEAARELERQEMHAVIGAPDDLSFVDSALPKGIVFDFIVSNTEDGSAMAYHYSKVELMVERLAELSVANHAALNHINSRDRGGGASGSDAPPFRPLIFFTSGCKDYGFEGSLRHGDEGLVGHTEESPLNTIPLLEPRCDFGRRLLALNKKPFPSPPPLNAAGDEGIDDAYGGLLSRQVGFDAVVLRPTCVYGLSGSHYAWLIKLADEAAATGVLIIQAPRNGIMHSLHIDDCAEAYVALAKADRSLVAGHAFNISNAKYETTEEVAEALLRLARETRPDVVLQWVEAPCEDPFSAQGLFNWPQWVRSDKIRATTGWSETRAPFAMGVKEYALAARAHASTTI